MVLVVCQEDPEQLPQVIALSLRAYAPMKKGERQSWNVSCLSQRKCATSSPLRRDDIFRAPHLRRCLGNMSYVRAEDGAVALKIGDKAVASVSEQFGEVSGDFDTI